MVSIFGLSSCQTGISGSTPTPTGPLPLPALTVIPASVTPAPSPTEALGALTPELTQTATLQANPYASLGIEALSERDYGGGELTIHETMGFYDSFTRYLVSYPSDGLEIYGFLNVPYGEGPFPVVIALHGYIDPAKYQTLDYTTRYADALARAGFLVIHPNLRGYSPSENGENLFRVGMATDVLNLAAIVRASAGQSGPLETASSERIGLWGHSMGGGITLRVLTVDPEIKAAVLYGSMSGDEERNFQSIFEWSEGTRGLEEVAVPAEYLDIVSPINFLDRIQASISIHHGEEDELVPPSWSDELCGRLEDLRLDVSCYTYPGQPHTFRSDGDQLFIERTIEFFSEKLAN